MARQTDPTQVPVKEKNFDLPNSSKSLSSDAHIFLLLNSKLFLITVFFFHFHTSHVGAPVASTRTDLSDASALLTRQGR